MSRRAEERVREAGREVSAPRVHQELQKRVQRATRAQSARVVLTCVACTAENGTEHVLQKLARNTLCRNWDTARSAHGVHE